MKNAQGSWTLYQECRQQERLGTAYTEEAAAVLLCMRKELIIFGESLLLKKALTVLGFCTDEITRPVLRRRSKAADMSMTAEEAGRLVLMLSEVMDGRSPKEAFSLCGNLGEIPADEVSKALIRINSLTAAERERIYETAAQQPASGQKDDPDPWDYTEYDSRFTQLEGTLLQLTRQVHSMHSELLQNGNEQYYRRLIEVYQLIEDTRRTMLEKLDRGEEISGVKAAACMKAFMEMIAEFLTDYGITVLSAERGERFDPHCQEAVTASDDYDPRTAVVAASLQSGFMLGEQMLQKERVTIEEQEASDESGH